MIFEKKELLLKMVEITSNEYMDKHHHYWNVFFKFLYADMFLLGVLLFQGNNINGAKILCSDDVRNVVLVTILGLSVLKVFIVFKEYVALLKIGKRYDDIYKDIPWDRLPDLTDKSKLCSKIDKFGGIGVFMFIVLTLTSMPNIFILWKYMEIFNQPK